MFGNQDCKVRWLRNVLYFFLLFISLGVVSSYAGNPHSAFYSSDSGRIFWFIHTSDTHIGTSGALDSNNLSWLVTTAKQVINPSFIVVSGDLTDSTNGNLFGYPNGPYQAEWDQYKSILNNWVTANDFYDLPGNHDAYNDQYFRYYLNNSIQGRAKGSTQISWTKGFTFGNYHFLGVNTCDNTGDSFSLTSPYGDHAGLDSTELGFIASDLSNSVSNALTFVFGHHPINSTGNSSDTYLYYGGTELVNNLDIFTAALYGYGHTHAYSEQFFKQDTSNDGFFYFNVASLGKSSANQYTITAVDCNGISSVTPTINSWPVVLITAPLDRHLGGVENPYVYTVPNASDNPIRALVFDLNSVTQVQYRIDQAVSWNAMGKDASNAKLWTAVWNASALTGGEHLLEVKATSASGTKTDAITVNVTASQTPSKIGVDSLATGKYVTSGKRNPVTTFSPTASFTRGDSIVFRAHVKNSTSSVANATVQILISGPQSQTLTTGPSDSNGNAEVQWKTQAPPKRGTGGTPSGSYTATIKGVTATGYVWDSAEKSQVFTLY